MRLTGATAAVRLGTMGTSVGGRTRRRIERLLRVSRAAGAGTRRARHMAAVVKLAAGIGADGGGRFHDARFAADHQTVE